MAVIGSLSLDLVAGETRVGGGVFHAARGLRLLGCRAVVVAKVGRPDLLPPLVGLGLPVCHRPAGTTPTFSFSYDGDVRHMHMDAVGEPWTPEDADGWVADALGGARWVHIAPLARSDFPAETLAALARGRRLSFDGQGLVRAPRVGPLALDADFDPGLLRHLTMLKLAEEEARTILPDFEEESLRGLDVPELVLTFGSQGSLVRCDGRLERVPAHPVEADATGAGDAFCAAYAAARAGGHAAVAAARRAAALVEALLAGRT